MRVESSSRTSRTGRAVALAMLLLPGIGTACSMEPDAVDPAAPIGEPLPGLTSDELARFLAGKALFDRQFTPEEGLGPRFNENACNACHTDPADGGTGETSVTKASVLATDGRCDPLAAEGGENVRRQATALLRDAGGGRVPVPEAATHVARFTIPFVFGLGIVDAVPQRDIDRLADPDDADGDGISGRVGRDHSGRPARFGRKADVATLRDFVESAFRLEMGLTTPAEPDEARAGAVPSVPEGTDPAADPELDEETIALVTDFVRFLAPPARAETADAATQQERRQGEELFTSLGCVGCHTPTLTAGGDASGAIANRSIHLYSDLLLHDMGPGLESVCAAGATTTEVRTEPLIGLRYRRIFLHDGRVGRVLDAILAHGGEAQAVRDRFAALDRVTQESLVRYLDSL